MADEWLIRRLRVVDEPTNPDPAFGEALYAKLASELGFEVSPATSVRVTAARGRARLRGPWRLLLVAALLVGGGAALGAGGFGRRGQSDRASAEVPDVCALISTTELAAIVGYPVTPNASWLGFGGRTTIPSSCLYEYGTQRGSSSPKSSVALSIWRYPDEATARGQIRPGSADDRTISGLGDAAALYNLGSHLDLYVVHGRDILSVSSFISGVLSPTTAAQMMAIARIIVSRLP